MVVNLLQCFLDGFDELSEKLQHDCFTADILKQKALPSCTIIVSSQPYASATICPDNIHTEVLGFLK